MRTSTLIGLGALGVGAFLLLKKKPQEQEQSVGGTAGGFFVVPEQGETQFIPVDVPQPFIAETKNNPNNFDSLFKQFQEWTSSQRQDDPTLDDPTTPSMPQVQTGAVQPSLLNNFNLFGAPSVDFLANFIGNLFARNTVSATVVNDSSARQDITGGGALSSPRSSVRGLPVAIAALDAHADGDGLMTVNASNPQGNSSSIRSSGGSSSSGNTSTNQFSQSSFIRNAQGQITGVSDATNLVSRQATPTEILTGRISGSSFLGRLGFR